MQSAFILPLWCTGDHLTPHGLSCRSPFPSSGVNDIIHRALTSAKIPPRLEPSDLSHTDGKHPDGVTIVSWKSGKTLVWDATCNTGDLPRHLLPCQCFPRVSTRTRTRTHTHTHTWTWIKEQSLVTMSPLAKPGFPVRYSGSRACANTNSQSRARYS